MDDHRYYWTVRATDNNTPGTWSSDSLMFVIAFIPDPPSHFDLVSPADSSTIQAYPVTLEWQRSMDPDYGDTAFYDVWMDTLAAMTTKWMVADSVGPDQFSVLNGLLEDHRYFWTVRATDGNTAGTWADDTLSFFVDMASATSGPVAGIPEHFYFGQNFPNPFNPSTYFEFGLPSTASVQLRIYDLLGREVATLVTGVVHAGNHRITWDCRTCPSGLYIAVMTYSGTTTVRKVTLLK